MGQREYLYYCKKCGRVVQMWDGQSGECDICKSVLYETPHEFGLKVSGGELTFKQKKASEQKLIEELVKTSPVFDEDLFNSKDAIMAQSDKERKDMMSKYRESTKYQPKCPTCGSPDVKLISKSEKAVGGAMWGLFSGKVRKSYKCNNCKYMW